MNETLLLVDLKHIVNYYLIACINFSLFLLFNNQ